MCLEWTFPLCSTSNAKVWLTSPQTALRASLACGIVWFLCSIRSFNFLALLGFVSSHIGQDSGVSISPSPPLKTEMSQDKVFMKKNIFYPKDISGKKNILNTKPKNKYREKSGIFHQPTVSKAWSPFTVHRRCARPQKIRARPSASQELRAWSHHPMLLKFQPRMCNALTSRVGFWVYPSCVVLTEHQT